MDSQEDYIEKSNEINEGENVEDLKVIEPDSPLMKKLQTTHKTNLLEHKQKLLDKILELEGSNKTKDKEVQSLETSICKHVVDIESQKKLLDNYQGKKTSIKNTKNIVDEKIDELNKLRTEMLNKISDETKKCSMLESKLDFNQKMIDGHTKYVEEQESSARTYATQVLGVITKKKTTENKRAKQELILSRLSVEIHQLQDRGKQLVEQATTTIIEKQLLEEKIIAKSTDLQVINDEIKKITADFNDPLSSLKDTNRIVQEMKNKLQVSQHDYNILMIKAKSYKDSKSQEHTKQNQLKENIEKLRKEQSILQKEFSGHLEDYNNLKEKWIKLLEMIEFIKQALSQVLFEQNAVQKEIDSALQTSKHISIQALKLENDLTDEIKKNVLDTNYGKQMSIQIKMMTQKIDEYKLSLDEAQNVLCKTILEKEQCNNTIESLDNNKTKNDVNEHKKILLGLNSELHKLKEDIRQIHKEIETKNKYLELNTGEDSKSISTQSEIKQAQKELDILKNKIDSMTSEWQVKQQNILHLIEKKKSVLNQIRLKSNEISVLNTITTKLFQETTNLSEEGEKYQKSISHLTNLMLQQNNLLERNKIKSNIMLDENEWSRNSEIAELEEKENHYLNFLDQLKLIKNELDEMHTVYSEKERENIIWQDKVKQISNMKNEIKQKTGDAGEIELIKKELRQMKFKEEKLKKIQAKLALDLEMCLKKHDNIYVNASDKKTLLREKMKSKQIINRKIQALQRDVKYAEKLCKNINNDVIKKQDTKIELETKLLNINEQIDNFIKDIDDITRKMDGLENLKVKNIQTLSFKQRYSKFLEEVQQNKYQQFIKDDSKTEEVLAVEQTKNSDLMNAVENLKNDYPSLDKQFTRLSNELFQATQLLFNESDE